MLLKQKNPQMDDFERKSILAITEKYYLIRE